MMSWKSTIYRILGKFWLYIFKDSWFIELIVKFFDFVIGNTITSRIHSIKSQLSLSSINTNKINAPFRLLVSTDHNNAVIDIGDIIIQSSAFQIGQTKEGVIYTTLNKRSTPSYLKKSVSSQDYFTIDKDFKIVQDKLQFKKPLSQYGFNTSIITIKDTLLQCYQLWGFNNQPNDSLIDNFSYVLNLPKQWLIKYPGSIQSAWQIKINGATKQNIQKFINSISDKSGTPKLFTFLDTIVQQDIPYIDVITDVGILKAINNTQQSIKLDQQSYILPLIGDNIQKYRQLCLIRTLDKKVPYMYIPPSVNPVQFIIKNVWRSSFILLLTYCSNKKDIQIASKFILNNIPKSTVLMVYNGVNYDRIIPSQVVEQTLNYYNVFDSRSN